MYLLKFLYLFVFLINLLYKVFKVNKFFGTHYKILFTCIIIHNENDHIL